MYTASTYWIVAHQFGASLTATFWLLHAHFFFLFFLFLALASYSGGEAYGAEVMPTVPEFDTAPKNITAIAGETISLPCSIEYKNEYKVGIKNVSWRLSTHY